MDVLLYFDEDFDHDDRVEACRGISLDILTPREARMLSQSDPAQVRFAASKGRLIVTHNRTDFTRIHKTMMNNGEHHSGICVVRMEAWYRPGEIARRRHVLAETFREIGTRDQLLFLSNFS